MTMIPPKPKTKAVTLPQRQLDLAYAARALLAKAEARVAHVVLPPRERKNKGRRTDPYDTAVQRAKIANDQKALALLDEADRLLWELALTEDRHAKLQGRMAGGSERQDDSIQNARIGLYKAARSFNPDRGFRFSTHAKWWARAVAAMDESKSRAPLRASGGAHETHRNAEKARSMLRGKLGREPRDSEVAEYIGKSVERLHDVTPVFAASDSDEDTPEVAAEAREFEHSMDIDRLWTEIDKLDKRQRIVIQAELEGKTLSETGRELGVSRERVRQTEMEAHEHLRTALAGIRTVVGWKNRRPKRPPAPSVRPRPVRPVQEKPMKTSKRKTPRVDQVVAVVNAAAGRLVTIGYVGLATGMTPLNAAGALRRAARAGLIVWNGGQRAASRYSAVVPAVPADKQEVVPEADTEADTDNKVEVFKATGTWTKSTKSALTIVEVGPTGGAGGPAAGPAKPSRTREEEFLDRVGVPPGELTWREGWLEGEITALRRRAAGG